MCRQTHCGEVKKKLFVRCSISVLWTIIPSTIPRVIVSGYWLHVRSYVTRRNLLHSWGTMYNWNTISVQLYLEIEQPNMHKVLMNKHYNRKQKGLQTIFVYDLHSDITNACSRNAFPSFITFQSTSFAFYNIKQIISL